MSTSRSTVELYITTHLADNRIVSGGDGVEDPLDALQLFLIARGDAIEGLVVVLQRSTALAVRKEEEEGVI